MQGWQGLLGLKDFKDLEVKLENLEGLAPPAHRVQEDYPDCLEKMVREVKMESPGQVDLMGHQENGGCLGCQGSLDQKAIEDFQDWMVPKEEWAVLVRKENRVALGQWDLLGQWDRPAQEERGDERGHQALLDYVELMGLLDLLEYLEL